jgi:hypothetical protein
MDVSVGNSEGVIEAVLVNVGEAGGVGKRVGVAAGRVKVQAIKNRTNPISQKRFMIFSVGWI